MSETGELKAGYECPICAWPEPHSHTKEEIAERPAIDGARLAFEKQAREFMLQSYFKDARTGFWWSYPARLAREDSDYRGRGWAHRYAPQGNYSNEFVNVMWLFWRKAWLAARAIDRDE